MEIFLSCFSAGSCFLLSFLLFFHPYRQNPKANKWLSLYIFAMGTAFIRFYLQETETGPINRLVQDWINCLQFLLSPFIYFSVLFFVSPTKKFSPVDALHFLSFIIFTCIYNLQLVIYGHISFVYSDGLALLVNAGSYFLPFQFLCYILLSYARLLKHKNNLLLITSTTKGIDLGWLRNFLLILLLMTLFWINSLFMRIPVFMLMMPLTYTVSVFVGAYYAIGQKTIFAQSPAELREISDIIDLPKKEPAKARRISQNQANSSYQHLKQLMENERLYLNSELSLADVAAKLGISIHDTSYLINELSGTNFYNFVNRYRVEEAKKLLSSARKKEFNILGIAFEAGFNSKTAFNTAFKKWTGVSPSQYISEQKSEA